MKISAKAAVFAGAAGALAYMKPEGGIEAFVFSCGAAAAAFGAAAVAHRRAGKVEKDVTSFASDLVSGKFSHFMPDERGTSGKMANALNTLARHIKNSVRGGVDKNERLSALLDEVSEGILCVSAEGRVTAANKTARAMLATAGEIEGKNYWEVIFSSQMKRLIEDALGGGETMKREIANLYPSENFYMASVARLKNGDAALILFDRRELKDLETAQKDLITNMSHEIRTPLTSIVGAAETIAVSAGENGETAKLARILERNTRRLADLCSRVIRLSEIEHGAEREEFDIAKAVENAAVVMKAGADARGVEVAVAEADGLVMQGDRMMIENMFVNLIENAVKYSPEGGKVEIAAVRRDDGKIAVSVKDCGAGIEKKETGRIFERFYRGAAARKEEGSGLGLSIALKTAEAHGGKIEVESEVGAGSVFVAVF